MLGRMAGFHMPRILEQIAEVCPAAKGWFMGDLIQQDRKNMSSECPLGVLGAVGKLVRRWLGPTQGFPQRDSGNPQQGPKGTRPPLGVSPQRTPAPTCWADPCQKGPGWTRRQVSEASAASPKGSGTGRTFPRASLSPAGRTIRVTRACQPRLPIPRVRLMRQFPGPLTHSNHTRRR